MCAKGSECLFFHRIPTPADDARIDELSDVFGRQKHSKHRDDMNGVGSFAKPCRTLYVANLQKTKYDTNKQLEDSLWKHFSEWGELENCNVIHRLSIAFPRYRYRTSAGKFWFLYFSIIICCFDRICKRSYVKSSHRSQRSITNTLGI